MAEPVPVPLETDALVMADRYGHAGRSQMLLRSDRRSLHRPYESPACCDRIGVTRSAGRTGICCGGTRREPLRSMLKVDLAHGIVHSAQQRAQDDIAHRIERRHDRRRIHEAIGCRTLHGALEE